MFKLLTGVCLYLCCFSIALAGDYFNKDVSTIRSPDGRPCTFFQLVDITDVDNTGSPWFALKEGSIGYKEMLTLLISSKIANKKVHISTTGNVPADCGHAEVYAVQMP